MRLINSALSLLCLFLISINLHASPIQGPNNTNTIHVSADSWNYNRKTGISIFLGEPVKIDQGTTHITAAKVITKQTDDKQIEEITAYRNETFQAHYWDTKTPNEPAFHAYAGYIHYIPNKALITLKDKAHVQQGQNHFKGSLIYYNMKNQTIIAPKTANSRTTIIYQPS